jgi:hypothetical protein
MALNEPAKPYDRSESRQVSLNVGNELPLHTAVIILKDGGSLKSRKVPTISYKFCNRLVSIEILEVRSTVHGRRTHRTHNVTEVQLMYVVSFRDV